MRMPIIVVEKHTCFDIFQSIDEVEGYVEAPEVMDGSTVAYDGDGNLLLLKPLSPIHVKVEVPDPSIDKSDDLRKDISDYLVAHHGHTEDSVSRASLSELIDFLMVAHKLK